MEKEIKENLKDLNTWLRLLFALFFALIVFYLVKLLVTIMLIVQFCSVLFTAKPIERLQVFSGQLSRYSFQILEYVGYNQEDKPFPFGDWPTETPTNSRPAAKKSTKKKSRRSVAATASTESAEPSSETSTESPTDTAADKGEQEPTPGDNK